VSELTYRCKHIKAGDGGMVDGCGYQGPHAAKCPNCGSAILRPVGAATRVSRLAIVFWDSGWYWVEIPHAGKQPIGPYDELDGAITAAKTAGFKIHAVNMTRGLLPAPGPQAPKDGIDGVGRA
jgi:hypothetical protein